MHELYRKHRPKVFKDVVGQPEAVKVLTEMVKRSQVAHAILFTGPSGCGKTTLARILKTKLECSPTDFCEINAADSRGIEVVRDIRTRMALSPLGGKSRVWLIDEAHKLTGDAQTALLKMLEDPPSHVYFMLCTTEPGKLLKTILTRCTEVKVKALIPSVMNSRLISVMQKHHGSKEGDRYLSDEIYERIVDVADGSARKALVILNQLIGIESEEEQLAAINAADAKTNGIEIARLLLNFRCKWGEIAKIIKAVDDEPESLRRMILAYMTNVALGGGKMTPRAVFILNVFRDNWYDCGKAGLVACCYEVVHSKS